MRPDPNFPLPPFTLNKGGRPATRKGYQQVQLYLQQPLYAALRAVAQSENRTAQECIREAIAQWLDRVMGGTPEVGPSTVEVSTGYQQPLTDHQPDQVTRVDYPIPLTPQGTHEVIEGDNEASGTEEVFEQRGRGLPFTL